MAEDKNQRLLSKKGLRLRKLNRRQRKQKAKTQARSRSPIKNSFRLTIEALRTIRRFWKPLGGIILVYLILNIILASGVSNLNTTVNDIKLNLEVGDSSNLSPFGTAINGFSNLVASAGTNGSSTGSSLQIALIVVVSLVIIWALRQLFAGKIITVKQAYYSSMTPLIPFLLVLLVIFIQLLPLTLGASTISALLSTIFVNGGNLSNVIMIIFTSGLLAWSLYMISGSLLSIYIVTLPDAHPRQALRSAKNLVAYRRWAIIRRLIYLPIFTLLLMGLVVIPLILYATFLVMPVFLVLSMFSLLFAHTYLYSLYRELIS